MFSAFWEEAYRQFFDGSTLLMPCMHANTDMASASFIVVASKQFRPSAKLCNNILSGIFTVGFKRMAARHGNATQIGKYPQTRYP